MTRPIATRTNMDHAGFYSVGDLKFYSKLEAIEVAGKLRKPVEWNFNKAVFEQQDWTKEPPGDLKFWYAERARQLRDKYNYLVLFYSGGADSHNILATFVENNIFVDEIVQFHQLESYNGEKNTDTNAEVFYTSAPITQQLIDSNPIYKNTKHRIIDISKFESTVLLTKENRWDYFYNTNIFFTPMNTVYGSLREIEPDYKRLADAGKQVCFVWGMDKPTLRLQNNKMHFGFYESAISVNINPRGQMANNEWQIDELFYWTPDLPEIAIKQAHVVMNYVQNLKPSMIDGRHVIGHIEKIKTGAVDKQPRAEIVIDGQEYSLTNDGVHKLIYPHWIPEVIVCPKTSSAFFSTKDDWLWKDNAPDVGQKRYQMSILWLRQHVKRVNPDMWWENKYIPGKNRPNGGFKSLANFYQITP